MRVPPARPLASRGLLIFRSAPRLRLLLLLLVWCRFVRLMEAAGPMAQLPEGSAIEMGRDLGRRLECRQRDNPPQWTGRRPFARDDGAGNLGIDVRGPVFGRQQLSTEPATKQVRVPALPLLGAAPHSFR
jgi:hypothetical protein